MLLKVSRTDSFEIVCRKEFFQLDKRRDILVLISCECHDFTSFILPLHTFSEVNLLWPTCLIRAHFREGRKPTDNFVYVYARKFSLSLSLFACRHLMHHISNFRPFFCLFALLGPHFPISFGVQVQHTKWWLSGIYCPLGRDVDEGRIVYMRGHVTSKDIIYLRESAAASEGCTAGQYILQIPSAGDFMDKSRGIFELRGQVKSCVNSITFAVQPCSTKALAFVEEEEKDEEGLPALILDDPSTAASADFWLHPCECAPSAWGTASPVNPKSFEQVPVDSQNDFIPSPFTIVTGQLVCPSRQLLPGVGVHFQSEEETMEPADCEARCRNHDDCHLDQLM